MGRGVEVDYEQALTKDRDQWKTFVRPYRRSGADGRD